MKSSAANLYAILGLQKDCSINDIKKAYRKLSLKFHPDRYLHGSASKKESAKARFQEINEAYHLLIDPAKRRAYDLNTRTHSSAFENSTPNPRFDVCEDRAPAPAGSGDFLGSRFLDENDVPGGDFKASYFQQTDANCAMDNFARWGNFGASRNENRASPNPKDATQAPSAGQRLMEEAKKCFKRTKSTNRGSKADGLSGFQNRTSRRIPFPPPDAQCSSGHAAMGRVPPTPGYSSPSSGELDDEDDNNSDTMSLEPSRVVVLHGLQSSSARIYNGKIGRILEASADSERWRVQLPGIPRVFRLLPANVHGVPCGVLKGLRTKSELNGREVILIGSAADGSARYDCALIPEQEGRQERSRKYCVRPKNVILSPGTRVELIPRGSKRRLGEAHYSCRSGTSETQVISYSRESRGDQRRKAGGGWYTLKVKGRLNTRAPKARASDIWVSFASYKSILPMVRNSLRLT